MADRSQHGEEPQEQGERQDAEMLEDLEPSQDEQEHVKGGAGKTKEYDFGNPGD